MDALLSAKEYPSYPNKAIAFLLLVDAAVSPGVVELLIAHALAAEARIKPMCGNDDPQG
jgi:hypothetical protein